MSNDSMRNVRPLQTRNERPQGILQHFVNDWSFQKPLDILDCTSTKLRAFQERKYNSNLNHNFLIRN